MSQLPILAWKSLWSLRWCCPDQLSREVGGSTMVEKDRINIFPVLHTWSIFRTMLLRYGGYWGVQKTNEGPHFAQGLCFPNLGVSDVTDCP